MEIENSAIKHVNGEVYNMSKNSCIGVFVTKNADKICKKSFSLF